MSRFPALHICFRSRTQGWLRREGGGREELVSSSSSSSRRKEAVKGRRGRTAPSLTLKGLYPLGHWTV